MEIKKFYLYDHYLLYLTGYYHCYIFEVISPIHLSDEIIKDLNLETGNLSPGASVNSRIDRSNMLFGEFYLGYEGFEKKVTYIPEKYQNKLKKYFSSYFLRKIQNKIKEELI